MVVNKSGKINNIASSVVNLLPEGESVYAASKAGLTFTKIISKELKILIFHVIAFHHLYLILQWLKKLKKIE